MPSELIAASTEDHNVLGLKRGIEASRRDSLSGLFRRTGIFFFFLKSFLFFFFFNPINSGRSVDLQWSLHLSIDFRG